MDHAISRWAGELQCLNHAAMFGTETVHVRQVGCYDPHEFLAAIGGIIPIFAYHALLDREFSVYRRLKRIFDYVENTRLTFANIALHRPSVPFK
jgi:dTDP-glucose 4,6-dehydratase